MYPRLTDLVKAHDGPRADDGPESFRLLQQVRQLITPVTGLIHMDVGLDGARLARVYDAVDHEACSTFAEVRHAIASGFGCDADEIVVTHSTTDGLCKAVGGLRLRAGDEIVTTTREHHGGRATLALARDRLGIVVRTAELPYGADQRADVIVDRISRAITRRTRALLFSAPTFDTGAMLPVRALADLAEARGIVTIVDGAHIPGMLAVKFRELGIDFLAASGTKWQYGPPGTGLLYIRNKVLPEFNRRPLPEFWPLISVWYPQAGGLPPRTRTRKASYDIAEYLQAAGAASQGRMQALQDACRIWDELGRERIEKYLLGLSLYLKERIAEQWGPDALFSPMERTLHSAICTFNPFRDQEHARDERRMKRFVSCLQERHGIVLRAVGINIDGKGACYGVRISIRILHDRNDVDHLIAAMIEAATIA
jgi:isopenicillin-N epimerase